ncbi:MAG: hypothetical protein U1F36_06520 [Planctomycetota bacterium]
MTSDPSDRDEQLGFTVASVWREERVSCPHADVLRAWLSGALSGGGAEFVAFHVEESKCPYCRAVVDEMRSRESPAAERRLEDVRDRLMRSTIAALRATRA